jgi:CheY-like chemotaxis protein
MKLKKNYCKKVHFEPQKLKILVAEDDSISLKFISKILKYLEIIY